MRLIQDSRLSGIVVMLAVIMTLVASAAAQMPATPTPVPPTPAAPTPPVMPPTGMPAASSGGGAGSVAVTLGLLAGLVVLITAGGKLLDLRRKRQAEAVHLQAQASDALLRDAMLASYPITPTAQVPFWRGRPATVVVSGQIPSPDLRPMVMRIVEQEAMRVRPDVIVEDRLTEAPALLKRAA